LLLGSALFGAGGAGASRELRTRIQRAEKRESEMVLVAAGSFIMGADDAERDDFLAACAAELGDDLADACSFMVERLYFTTGPTRREVHLSAFWIDRLEVTTADYRECVQYGPCDLRPLAWADTRYAVDTWPMVNVTWDDADTYCRYRNKRLPSEAEWEKAARGTDGRRYPWGDFARQDGANHGRVNAAVERPPAPGGAGAQFSIDDRDGYRELAPPGALRFGRSPNGALDMAGNAAEWVADWFGEAPLADFGDIDPTGAPTGFERVVKGGSFFEPLIVARSYFRSGADPSDRSITRGFRCARTAAPEPARTAAPEPAHTAAPEPAKAAPNRLN
jgi:formylglycine-generating enzyme required for sulfatase activity